MQFAERPSARGKRVRDVRHDRKARFAPARIQLMRRLRRKSDRPLAKLALMLNKRLASQRARRV